MKIQNGISLKPPTPEAKAADTDAKLKDAAKMYENYFLNEMVKAMRSTVKNEDGYVKPNFAEKIFSEQLDQQYVQGWSDKGGVGLADLIYTQIKERFAGATAGRKFPVKSHMMPIAPQKDGKGPGASDSIQIKSLPATPKAKMGYRFEVPDRSSGAYEVQAPMAGKVTSLERLDADWNLLRLDHGLGLMSEMTFPGRVTETSLGQEVQPGQRLGLLHLERPVLAWNLDWKEV